MRKTWQRDDTARHCTCCGAHFTHFVRRHHCRCCGRIFCNDCSQHFVEIPPEWRTTNYTGKDHLSWPSYIGTFFKPCNIKCCSNTIILNRTNFYLEYNMSNVFCKNYKSLLSHFKNKQSCFLRKEIWYSKS